MRQEASESSWQYIELVPEGDICDILEGQQDAVVDLLTNALGNKAFYRYAADKWTVAARRTPERYRVNLRLSGSLAGEA